MPRKVEVDGETYIVSEDVDFDQLDTDNMVEKPQPVEVVVRNPYAGLTSIPLEQVEQNKEKQEEIQNKTRPKITFVVQFAKRLYSFNGEYCWSEIFEHSTNYKVRMDFAEAMKLQKVMLKSQTRSDIQGKRVLFIKAVIDWLGEEKYEYTPPKGKKGITSQKLERVKIYPRYSKRDKDVAYVEIDFGSIHWR